MHFQNTHFGASQLKLVASLTLGLLLLLFPSLVYAVSPPASWLDPGTPSLQQTSSLAPNILPPVRDTDCTSYTYIPKLSNDSAPRTLCTFETSLGTVGNSNELFTGPRATLPIQGIEGVSNNDFLLPPSPDGLQPVGIPSSTALGNYLGFYSALTRSSLRLNGSAQSGYYTLKTKPDNWVKDDTGALPLINTAVMAYSASGDWLVADMPTLGLSRINLKTFAISPFAPALEKPCSIAPSFAKLAISDDGRYVAVSPQGACQSSAGPALEIYDTSTCNGLVRQGVAVQATCRHKDIWNGQTDGEQVDSGLAGKLAAAQRPANLSFINDQNLSFAVAYDYTSDSNFSTGSFLVTVGGGSPHLLGLLGIGDSYISGQGEFTYRSGTDTATNGCHLSELSYPFLMSDHFASFNSVACSGAISDDITRTDGSYRGQVTDKVEQRARNAADILGRFLPGYIGQNRFVQKYQPEAVLVSIGGNDVGFAKLVARCAAPSRSEPVCFDSWEDRADLVNLIDGKYNRFVATLKTIRRAAPASRLYVVGYPQIAKPGGNCGVNVQLTDKEVLFAADLISYLDGVIKQAAAEAGVAYVDVEHALDGQRLCEGHSPSIAVNGFTTGGDDGITLIGHRVKFIGFESYHPTVAGHRLLAQSISRTTNNLTTAMPAPQPNLHPPALSSTLSLLQNVAVTGRPLKVVSISDQLTEPQVTAGSSHTVRLDGTAAALQPGGHYTVSLQSSAAPLTTVTADADGNLNLNLSFPPLLLPGYDVIHIYGQNVSGDDIDVQQIVYIAAVADDPSDDTCLTVPDSGQDIDSDGIDDACDPVIGDSPPRSYPPVVKLTVNSLQVGTP